ncbi:hypothetical protein [Streptococcus orisratti]
MKKVPNHKRMKDNENDEKATLFCSNSSKTLNEGLLTTNTLRKSKLSVVNLP